MSRQFVMDDKTKERIENLRYFIEADNEMQPKDLPMWDMLKKSSSRHIAIQLGHQEIEKYEKRIAEAQKEIQKAQEVRDSYDSVLSSQFGADEIESFLKWMEEKKKEVVMSEEDLR